MQHLDDHLDGDHETSFDAALDGLASGVIPPMSVADSNLATFARRFHNLDSRDRSADPRSAFVRRLEEELMSVAQPTAASAESRSPAGVPGMSTVTRPAAPRLHSASRFGRFRARLAIATTAAMLALTVAALIVTFRFAPGTRENAGLGPASPTAAIPATSDVRLLTDPNVVDLAECDTQPRNAGSVAALVDDPPTRKSTLPIPTEELDRLPDADAATRSGVELTLRQLLACRFYLINPYDLPEDWTTLDPYDDYDGQYYALFSDDHFRRYLTDKVSNVDLPVLSRSFLLVGANPPEIEPLKLLPDGRVVGIVPEVTVPDYANIVVFVREGERWLIDELADIVPDRARVEMATPAGGTPAPRADPAQRPDPPQFLEGTLRDHRARHSALRNEGIYRADMDVTVTIANLGDRPHTFAIPGIGFEIVIEPGRSESFVLNVSPGTYQILSWVLDIKGDPMTRLDRELEFLPPGVLIPQG